jgi:hypothetical protein
LAVLHRSGAYVSKPAALMGCAFGGALEKSKSSIIPKGLHLSRRWFPVGH